MSRLRSSLKALVFPDLCVACRVRQPKVAEELCSQCLDLLPFIPSIADATAALAGKKHFPDNVDEFASLFYYSKESYIAEMIHYIKYDGLYKIGTYLGEKLYERLLSTLCLDGYVIIPVPLHPKKVKIRGYNQAQKIALGISNLSGLPIIEDFLIRTKDASSQTQKSQTDRSKILEDAFDLNPSNTSAPKKIMLVDDVITTGSTISACTKAIMRRTPEKLIVASIGVSI